MGLSRYPEVAQLTIEAVGPDVVEGMLCTDEATASHGMATGAMTMEAMRFAGCSEQTVALGGIAGALHDVGKFHPRIQHLMADTQDKKFTPAQAKLMQTHTTRGYLSLAGQQVSVEQSPYAAIAAHTALRHHAQITPETYRKQPLLEGICHTVQLCDVAHARLFDASRSYRKARDGVVYTSQQIGQQIIAQFIDFPPTPDGKPVPVEHLVLNWVEEATRRQELSQELSTLD